MNRSRCCGRRKKDYWKIVSWKVGADDAADAGRERLSRSDRACAHQRRPDPGAGGTGIPRKLAGQERTTTRRSPTCRRKPMRATTSNATRPSPRRHRRRMRGASCVRASRRRAPRLGTSRSLDAMLSAPEPLHPAVRVMNHPFSRVFSLTSMPNALADAAECGARAFASSTRRSSAARIRRRLQHEHSIQHPQRRRAGDAHALAQGERRLADHVIRRRGAVTPLRWSSAAAGAAAARSCRRAPGGG